MKASTYLVFLLNIIILLPLQSSAKEVNVTLLTFADVYNILPNIKGGGLLSLEGIILSQKQNSQHSFVLVSGDVLATNGPERTKKGKAVIDILNKLNIDFASLGNHEFAFGVNNLKKRIRESNFVWLTSNVVEKGGSQLDGTTQTIIKEIEGLKIGFFAICLPETAQIYFKSCNNKVIFNPIISSTQLAINFLISEGADVIVALTHLNIAQDIMIAETFPQINVIAGGHDHQNISMYIGNTLIHKSGTDGKFLGRIDLKISKVFTKTKKGNSYITYVYPSWQTISNLKNKL